ncbi:Guanine nucleotide exchange factor synembryn [Phytophthora infestans]|uniref:Guanine nucleotide exchange factor synembryn n=1 Tax=Phytophthora infestans TaxID=4787 RepID=A0A833TAV0_PHYIN|nr:Guanine nucleotide exchange factor synembryn [Phytophthora infestans]KAF4145506.1 Guanine nucleotide exchange factor synembryn [Phytophthora infestans]
MTTWIETFARAVENGATELDAVLAREEAVDKIRAVLEDTKTATVENDKAIYRLLGACRVFMRDQRGIDKLLSAESLDSFMKLAEDGSWSSPLREEALKCMINSVYSRPEFVSETLIVKGFVARLLRLAKQEGTVSLHWLVWKVLLVSGEAPEIPRYLSSSLEVWQLIYVTLLYGYKHQNQAYIVTGDRATLLLDLVKLIAVLVNEMQWTAEQEKLLPDVFNTVHRLGRLLLEILQFKHPNVSPLTDNLLDLKNKVIEVLMLLPESLLAAFIQQQQQESVGLNDRSLVPVLDHLHSMLLVVRVEKTRPLKEMLPTLIVCHNLVKTGGPDILTCFKKAILPTQDTEASAGDRTKAFFFKHLKFFLTCLDTDVRRYASEWLFLLCDENAKEYTHHTGVGNAIGLLRMKGLA